MYVICLVSIKIDIKINLYDDSQFKVSYDDNVMKCSGSEGCDRIVLTIIRQCCITIRLSVITHLNDLC